MDVLNYCLLLVFLQLVVVSHKGFVSTISCFTCSSRNHSDKTCEDPYQPGPQSLKEKCAVPKRGHEGEFFPAHFCIKMVGISGTTNEKLVVRRCVLANMDDQCGKFKLDNDTLRGCILTCNIDGCNNSISNKPNSVLMYGLIAIAILCTFFKDNVMRSDYFFPSRCCFKRKVEKIAYNLSSQKLDFIKAKLEIT